MATDAGFVKVGIARDAEARLRTLQTGSPFDLRLARYIDCEADGVPALALEQRMHVELSHCRARGEWFSASLDEVERAIRLSWAYLARPSLYERYARRFRPGRPTSTIALTATRAPISCAVEGACETCGGRMLATKRRRFCSDRCRVASFRRKLLAPSKKGRD